MEVHHPHHPSHKKKWSEYIIEFVMLFAAVTLGFFAENVREHQLIEHKTHQNLQSVILDLKKDSILIRDRIYEYDKASNYLDTLNHYFLDYKNNLLTADEYVDKVIAIEDSLNFGTSFYINNSSYKNTISSGSFSSIKSIELKRQISDYYEVYASKLYDNNKILDDVVEYYTINTFPKPGGRFKNKIKLNNINTSEDFKKNNDALNTLYKKNGLFNKSLLSNDFIIYNQKALDRVAIYLFLMKLFNEKNNDLIKSVNIEINEN